MHIFTLELENDDLDYAEFVSARETSIEFERHLESWLENNPWTLVQGDNILWIGRQTSAPVEDATIFPDLLGVDARGNLVIVELKRNRTPRDTVAQLLDYATWANELSESRIHEIAEHYFHNRNGASGKTFSEAFREGLLGNETGDIPPLNRDLRLFVVAGRISDRILKVCSFLRISCRMDVSCIEVSLFRTESGDAIVSMETKLVLCQVINDGYIGRGNPAPTNTSIRHLSVDRALGGENRVGPNIPQTAQEPDDTLRWQTTWRAILELTNGDPNGEFTTRAVRDAVLTEHPGFSENTISGNIHSFRGSRYIVSEAIQGLRTTNANIKLTSENIMEAALEGNPGFSQPRIREMIDLFFQSESIQIQPNQREQGSEN